jgi:hypothetical protein
VNANALLIPTIQERQITGFLSTFEGHYQALWWVPQGARPTIDEGLSRLWKLNHFGPSCDAFTFKSRFLPPNHLGAPVDMNPDPWCMGRA